MIKELLKNLKMPGALETLKEIDHLQEKEEYLIALLQAEIALRKHNQNKRRLSQAKFPHEKSWEEIDPTLNPQIDFKKIEKLENSPFLEEKENLCLIGEQGTGKTHSLIALGREICRKGKTVKFYTASKLVTELEEAKMNHTLAKKMQTLEKPELLIIDELGYIPFNETGARLLFDIFGRRYERGSIAVSTNLTFDKWVEIFGTPELTAALVDRFTHRCHIYTYQGKSARFEEARRRKEKQKSAT